MYTTCGKQVLRNGENFAQACDNGAATLIADVLNARPRVVLEPKLSVQPIPFETTAFAERLALSRLHHRRQENDEYACSCGARWDVAEGEQHP